MKKEELRNKCMELFLDKDEFVRLLDFALNDIDCDRMESNYLPAYGIVRGIYDHHTRWMECAGSYKSNRFVKRIMRETFYSVFHK